MKISVSMYSLASTIKKENWSVLDFIDYAKRITLDGVELLSFYWENAENMEQEIELVKEALKESNLQVSAYDISNNFVKDSKEEQDKEVRKVLDGIQVAKKLGTNIVRVFCGDLHENLTFENGAELIVSGLKRCAEMAEKERVYLAIENHGLLAGKSSQINNIIQEVNSPFVKSTFDTGNFLLVHESPEEAFDQLKNEIVHVHFKDFREKEQGEELKGFLSTEGKELFGVIPGDGKVNLEYIVNGLKEVKYDGWLSIEYEGLEDAKLANEEAVNRLRKLLNEGGENHR
ncbi:sugar phosphate isomerase/epimerase [Psychrobacillus sp. INOP01]|uniref:sugar phosphate isomerase/epimerase family protein n=1 Tax=Psychrobacillus sp. INOP01 TaxID=2829187 RepID=UPI001BA6D00F|nr:sugar phosphate isomerase/epimerase family protein [Psychrobacillus sp. INOP01]QUG40233.1 sugar phosphate isomerase/epimerase [Psychrobacillus sp. INOP01]